MLEALTIPELKAEIRRLKISLNQKILEPGEEHAVYDLSCAIDRLVVEYQKRATKVH